VIEPSREYAPPPSRGDERELERERQRLSRLHDAKWRLGFAAGLLAVVGLAILAASRSHPALEARFETLPANPPTQIRAEGIPADYGEDSRDPAPLDADVANIALAALGSGPLPAEDPRESSTVIEIPVPASDCPQLERRLGGACDSRSDEPARRLENIEIRPADRGQPLSLQAWPRHADAVELTRTGQRGSSNWVLEGDASRTELLFRCPVSAVLVIELPEPHRVRCALTGTPYRLAFHSAGAAPLVSLDGVTELKSHLSGQSLTVATQEGILQVGDRRSELGGITVKPFQIISDAPELTSLALNVTSSPSATHVTMESSSSSAVEFDGVNRVPTLLEGHQDLAFFGLGTIAGFLLTALSEYLLARRK
jgi:hypothetical protein